MRCLPALLVILSDVILDTFNEIPMKLSVESADIKLILNNHILSVCIIVIKRGNDSLKKKFV